MGWVCAKQSEKEKRKRERKRERVEQKQMRFMFWCLVKNKMSEIETKINLSEKDKQLFCKLSYQEAKSYLISQNVSEFERKRLKILRRTYLNRIYAQNCRERKRKKEKNMEDELNQAKTSFRQLVLKTRKKERKEKEEEEERKKRKTEREKRLTQQETKTRKEKERDKSETEIISLSLSANQQTFLSSHTSYTLKNVSLLHWKKKLLTRNSEL